MTWLLYTLVFVIMGIAVVGTILVGVSQANREGNPSYFKKTKANITRLTLFYILCFGAAVIALIAYIVHYVWTK
ncbi:hypothetical protein SD70_10910 [Gordoniibacillus kamchatkensis]|uniref:Protein-export membrane protein SecG n=1 Tax=Gordoniibacillus kamchatkensis TaxID=1590651 RepID=A0ABR5AIR3_9BACL|nr:hypothetical protein [Paenibacillus sp. VKM B-2647]KIL40921.1 hypothetical protein SD70_10910 [Paenibacillus sp. VKM B-2647]